MIKKIVGLLITLVALGVVVHFVTRSKPSLLVGDCRLTEKDIDLRDEIIRLSFPGEKRNLGREQLIHSCSAAAIMKRYGRRISGKEIDAEEARIRRESLMPDRLAAIEALFRGDDAAFKRVFVFPTLVDRVVYYEFFLHHPGLQERSRTEADEFRKDVGNEPRRFETICRQRGLVPLPVIVPRKGGPEIEPTMREFLAKNPPPKMLPRVVDMGEHWAVILYRKKTAKEFRLEAAYFDKADFDEWFEREKAKL